MKHIQSGLVSAFIYLAVMPVAANAQSAKGESADATDSENPNGIPEIVVTAERRAANIQDIASSVSVRAGSELAKQGKFTTRAVLEDVPGVIAEENNSRNTGSSDVQGNNITIRGVTPGETAGPGFSQISPTPATAVYVDGVYEGVGGAYDLDRVEVLRGPQGTLYGRSATAGVVAFHTRNPTQGQFEVNGSAEYGSYDLQHYTGGVSVPLGSTLALRVSGDYYDQDKGYFGEGDRGKRERLNGRAKLLWEPNDNMSVLLGYAHEDDRAFSGGNITTSNQAGVLTTLTAGLGKGRKIQNQYWGEVNWDLGPVVVTYQPAYRTWKQNDNNIMEANFFGSGMQLQQFVKTPKNTFHTQELRIASDRDSALSWLAGAFFYENKLDTSLRNFLANASNVEVALQSQTADQKNTKSIGAFAEATYAVTPDLRLTLGARYDDTKILFSETAYENPYSLCGTILAGIVYPPFLSALCTGPGTASGPPAASLTVNDLPINFSNFNYKARIEYDLSGENMLYGSISTGFRPGDGGINSVTLPPPQLPILQLTIYDAEKLTAFEIGSKNQFMDNKLILNAAAFFYNYSGYNTTYLPNTPAFDPGFRGTAVRTTVPARMMGGELELLYRPSAHDQFSFNYNYVRFRWADKPAAFAQAQTEAGRAIVPHTMQASYQHSFDVSGGGSIQARIDGKYESAHRTDDLHIDFLTAGLPPFPAQSQAKFVTVGDRAIGNAQLGFVTDDKRFSLTAYVRNFTDARHPALTVGGNLNAIDVYNREPRTFGIIASAKF
jgi:outer membrane receptor protein involved in Fe transport